MAVLQQSAAPPSVRSGRTLSSERRCSSVIAGGASSLWSQPRPPMRSLLRSFTRCWPTWRQHWLIVRSGSLSSPPQRWSNNQVRRFFILQTLKPAAATWEITFCFFARIRSQVHIARMLLERRAEDPARHHMMSGLLFTWTTLMVIPSRRRTVVVFLVEWRETWRFLHTLMKVCWSFCWHVNLVLLVSRFAQKLLHNNYQDLISIPCVFVLPANGCSHSLVHSNTII